MRILSVLFACLAACLSTPAVAAPLAAYGKLPTVEDGAISPGGGLVALVITNGERRVIVVQDLATEQVVLRQDTGAAKVREVRWADDRRLLITTSITTSMAPGFMSKGEHWMAYALDTQTRKVTTLLGDNGDRGMNVLFSEPTVRIWRGKPTIFVQSAHIMNWYARTALYRIDLETMRSTLMEPGEESTIDWVVGPDGQPVAQEFYVARSGVWTLKVRTGAAGWREVASVTALVDRPNLLGLGRDGASVLYAFKENDQWSWREARLDGAPPSAPIPIDAFQSPIRDPQDGRMIGHIALEGDEMRRVFFDPSDDKAWKAVKAAFPGEMVGLVSWSANRRKILVHVDSATEGPAYAVVDLDARKAQWLGPEYADLTEKDIFPRKAIRYTAADGMTISGYLTLPATDKATNLPLVVFPHGGPASRDQPGFDWWAQAMASRGYAVLQPNFRGSAGLGVRHLEAGYGQWGRKMQTDLSDGVRYLAAQGTIDPKRVCILGASYGGYAALAGATIDTGVYRCAVSVSGLSDLRKLVDGEGRSAQRYWKRFMGVENLRDPALADISPITHAGKVSIPVMLIHGRDDTVVPLEQSQIMAAALQKAGKPVELLVQKGEDHWLSRGETRLETLTASMSFIEKHNPPN